MIMKAILAALGLANLFMALKRKEESDVCGVIISCTIVICTMMAAGRLQEEKYERIYT